MLTPSDMNAESGNAGRKDRLAWIGDSLPLEVLINEAVLHQIAPRRTHRADYIRVLEGGYEGRVKLFYKDLERERPEVNAV